MMTQTASIHWERAPGRPAILIVDDLPQNQLALEAVLEPLAVRVVRANSGVEALRRLLYEDFALIFLDVQMPGLDGLETARLIKQRARTAHVPIIFITASFQDRAHVESGYLKGAVDYLIKPVDPEILRRKASVFVDLYESARESRSQARIGALSEAREAFTTAAHELRTPLTAARLQTQLADQQVGQSPQKTRHQLQVISRQIDRLDHLVDDLLDVTPLQSGLLALHRSDVELRQLVDEVVERMRATTRRHHLSITGAPTLRANADRGRLDQVLTNLLANSIRYSPLGGAVEVHLSHREGYACLSVRDEGLGIPPEKLQSIFDRFSQAHGGVFGGLGLGLSIVRELVQAHGGRIWAESEGAGAGTTVHVELPLAGLVSGERPSEHPAPGWH